MYIYIYILIYTKSCFLAENYYLYGIIQFQKNDKFLPETTAISL